MPRFNSLSINTKFNLIMSLLLVTLFVAAALLTFRRQQSLILKVAVDNSRNYALQVVETRDYISSVVKGEPEHNYALVPQVVATQVAKRITGDKYYYLRQVSLRYRNPENRPDEYETRQLQRYVTGPAKEAYEVVKVDGKETFRYMLPMKAEKSCLECHGPYDSAPHFVQQRFPRGHFSYNYKVGEVIGAVSVSIPMEKLYREIGANLKADLAYRAGIFLLIITVLAALIRRSIITPVTMLAETITQVTRTGDFSRRLPKKTNDEIGRLIGAFNDMMGELGRKTVQQQESEERYRKFIEMAQSAVVTFMADGKIVIANQKAEEMLGLSRQELLGESIFSYLVDGEGFRGEIEAYLKTGSVGEIGDKRIHQVLSVTGASTVVEIALSASTTDEVPLFTAILRKQS
jgi:PAS domain S-box-containing protein